MRFPFSRAKPSSRVMRLPSGSDCMWFVSIYSIDSNPTWVPSPNTTVKRIWVSDGELLIVHGIQQ